MLEEWNNGLNKKFIQEDFCPIFLYSNLKNLPNIPSFQFSLIPYLNLS